MGEQGLSLQLSSEVPSLLDKDNLEKHEVSTEQAGTHICFIRGIVQDSWDHNKA